MSNTVVEVITGAGVALEITQQPATTIDVQTRGPQGHGVPVGGMAAQVLRKTTNDDFATEWHGLVKADVGLANADNTSDANKPVSTAQAAAIAVVQADVDAHEARLDNPHAVTKAQVGLANADNTSDANKPISIATQTALDTINTKATTAQSTIDTHAANVANPHAVTKAQVGLANVLNVAQIPASEKGAANGVTPLGADSKVPAAYLPSYVDDVLEYANLAAFPGAGASGILYVALDTNKVYRWSGSAYVEISASPGSTDAVPEGATNLYFTEGRVRSAVLTGLSLVTNAAIAAGDSVLSAFGKLQKQLTDLIATVGTKANADNAALTGTATAVNLTVSGNPRMTGTGAMKLNSGTTAQRPANEFGLIRANSETLKPEFNNGTAWGSVGGGATGGGNDAVFHENDQTVTTDYTLTTGKNAMSAGPITIANGVTVTVPNGAVWTIV